MEITPPRWKATCDYLDSVFGCEDEHLATLMPRAIEAGIPDIAVSSSVGRLLLMLAKLASARTIVEVGTLAGYSGIWLARGMDVGGRLITIEPEPMHAEIARQMFDKAKLKASVEIRPSTGLDELPRLIDELGAASVDLVFLDALKTEYPEYLPLAKKLLRPGGLLVADNALGSGDWWIDTAAGVNANRDGADRFNHMVAADGDFDAACVPIREGLMVARKKN